MLTPHKTTTLAAKPPAPERAIANEVQQPRRLWRLKHPGLSAQEADRIAVRVMGRLTGRLLRLRIHVRHDGFVLSGRVRSYYVKQLIQEAVRKETDVPIAENAVEVV